MSCKETWKDAKEPRWPEDPDGVYYRPLLTGDGVVVCDMQWFDEPDYDQDKFLTEELFASREAALDWVREKERTDMALVDRIQRRLEKERKEREVSLTKDAPRREERYKEIEGRLAEYDALRREHPYTVHEDARAIYAHILDEYGHDLVWFFRRVRAKETP